MACLHLRDFRDCREQHWLHDKRRVIADSDRREIQLHDDQRHAPDRLLHRGERDVVLHEQNEHVSAGRVHDGQDLRDKHDTIVRRDL